MAKGKKTGGRKKGVPNKATTITREYLAALTADVYEQVKVDFMSLTPSDRVRFFLKLCEFQIPKPQSILFEDITQDKETIEQQLILLAEGKM